jgi:hypothetical protein
METLCSRQQNPAAEAQLRYRQNFAGKLDEINSRIETRGLTS